MRMGRMGSVFSLCAAATALAVEQDPAHETAIRAALAGYLSPISETARARDAAPAWPQAREKEVRVTGWVSDESCGAEHRKPGGEDCVRKCIKGAPHLNPEWTAQRMVFVTDDDAPRIWMVTNPESLTGYEGKHLRVEGTLENEGQLTLRRAQPVDE